MNANLPSYADLLEQRNQARRERDELRAVVAELLDEWRLETPWNPNHELVERADTLLSNSAGGQETDDGS